MELGTWQDRFDALGVNVVAITYDDREVLNEFASDQGLRYALLSDPNGEYMAALSIRNEEYGPDSPAFGIPHPGVMLIDSSRTVLYKAAEENYRARPLFEDLFAAVSEVVGEAGSGSAEEAKSGIPKACKRRRAARRSSCKQSDTSP